MLQVETRSPVLKSCKNSSSSAGPDSESISFPGPTHFCTAVRHLCQTSFGICDPSVVPWTVADREVLEQVQKRAIRMVSGLRGREYEDRLAELGLTTLEERLHQADMAMVYKIL